MSIHPSLRTKGLLAISALIAYLALTTLFVGRERSRLAAMGHEMDACRDAVSVLAPVEAALTHSLVETQRILNVSSVETSASTVLRGQDPSLEMLNVALQTVGVRFPSTRPEIDGFRAAVGALKAEGSAAHLAQVRDAQQILMSKVHGVSAMFQNRADRVAARHRELQYSIGVFALGANIVGALASVAVIVIFFTRLANDIKRLEARASAIVGGYDGEALERTRHDEVGGLIDAVNRMQAGLRRSEREVEIARQQRFHKEKMAAVGSLASAIGHEVRNPIAAISGVAQFIASESAEDPRPQARRIQDFAQQIVKQTERISHILRQLSALTAPTSPEPVLLDLNALVRSTCGFIRYDKRFRGVEFSEDLASGLPAVTAVADHMTQVLMNLLLNAADAVEDIEDTERRRIEVSTRIVGDEVHLCVGDRGRGMTPDVLARAFDEAFTTKPATRGSGVGLFICRRLIEKIDGRLELVSAPGHGTTATIRIPLHPRSTTTPI
jgi:two-component system, NtrC family, sensor kinase